MSGPGDNKTYDANGVMASVYDPALRALRISGSGASGAPANASYVTMVAESGLSNESVLGSAVIMTGVLGSRPAAATAGRLYAATDNGIIYRDTGSVWSAIANLTATGDQNASYSGSPLSAPNNATTYLTWDSLGAGSALLDLTDPSAPTVLVAGIYSVTASIEDSTAVTVGGGLQVVLHLDHSNQDAVCEATYGVGSRADGRYLTSLNNTFYIPAGGVIAVTIFNADGAVAHDVHLREAIIQRVQ